MTWGEFARSLRRRRPLHSRELTQNRPDRCTIIPLAAINILPRNGNHIIPQHFLSCWHAHPLLPPPTKCHTWSPGIRSDCATLCFYLSCFPSMTKAMHTFGGHKVIWKPTPHHSVRQNLYQSNLESCYLTLHGCLGICESLLICNTLASQYRVHQTFFVRFTL